MRRLPSHCSALAEREALLPFNPFNVRSCTLCVQTVVFGVSKLRLYLNQPITNA